MNTTSRVITGGLMILIGLGMGIGGFFANEAPWVFWLYGLIILVVGFFLFFNKKEDEIEQIKSEGGVARSRTSKPRSKLQGGKK